jgi:hypothetical protein
LQNNQITKPPQGGRYRKDVKMERILTTDGKAGVELVTYADGRHIHVHAIMSVGSQYANNGQGEYWFTVGRYLTRSAAIRWARKRLAAHGLELAIN